ncbi:Electron transfer flavoprotein alpha-subunit [Entomophthora muscae]|uniref:Electron transfer flavoprotein alpha-subunit n=1 Tax=Entomophthora muscae TaxID=34485 RepID=A0ACC2THP7_9FUNG|nr:Electron transfer flavoprotein alpha-subunit [Entomophthora muscae]
MFRVARPAFIARQGLTSVAKRTYASSSPSTLLVIEQKDGKINTGSLSALTAATSMEGASVTALVTGANPDELAKQVSKLQGITKVLVAKNDAYEHPVAESFAPLLLSIQKTNNFTHIFGGHTAFGKNVFPRFAALLDVAQISDITGIESSDTFIRPIYAGNAIAKVKSKDAVKIITVRGTAFAGAGPSSSEASIEAAGATEVSDATKWVGDEIVKSDRPELDGASRVISGGRGLKNGENFKLLYTLADKLGAAVGASRAAVDAGYADNSLQVGQTGKIIAPELYVAVGISGAIQHLAGMKDSKVIVAINKDADAPIFQVADYGLVEDLFKAVPELTEKL